MAIANIVLGVVLSCIVAACVYDVEGNSVSRGLLNRVERYARLRVWLPLGITYALFYATRYNIPAGNTEQVREQFGLTMSDFGTVISFGFWTYAFFAPFAGVLTDRIGGRKGILIATIGCGISNAALGVYFNAIATEYSSLAIFGGLFMINIVFQSLGTASVAKITASLYYPQERGAFSGVFNVLVSSGYYFALGQCPAIVASLGFSYVFIVPAAGFVFMFCVLYVTIPATVKTTSSNSKVSTIQNAKYLFRDIRYMAFLAALMCLCWVRDGFLSWMSAFFAYRAGVAEIGSDEAALLGGAVTFGGMLGSFVCGFISDRFFQSKRIPSVLIFSALQVVFFIALYATNVFPSLFVMLFCGFMLGNYTMISYTVPQDLPADVVATATGILTAAGYCASGLSSTVLSQMSSFIPWFTSILGASIAIPFCILIGVYFSKSKSKKNGPKLVVIGSTWFTMNHDSYPTLQNAGIQDEFYRQRVGSDSMHLWNKKGTAQERINWRLSGVELNAADTDFFKHRSKDPTSYFGHNDKVSPF